MFKNIISGTPEDILSNIESLKHLNESDQEQLQTEDDIEDQESIDKQKEGELVGEEEKETGVVKLSVYKSYWKAVGNCLAPMVLLSLLLMQGE